MEVMTQSPAETPPFLLPFVLPVKPVQPVRDGTIDWYLPTSPGAAPDAGSRAPAVVFVHGAPAFSSRR